MTDTATFKDPNEKIFRAAKPKFLFLSSQNKVSDTLFDLRPNEKGVSFDRAMGRSDEESCKGVHNRLSGYVISLKTSQCNDIDEIYLAHTPSSQNNYHSEIFYQTVAQEDIERAKHILAEKSIIEPY